MMELEETTTGELFADALRQALDTVLAEGFEGLRDISSRPVKEQVITSERELISMIEAVTKRLEPALVAEAARILLDTASKAPQIARSEHVSQLSRWRAGPSRPHKDAESLEDLASVYFAIAELPDAMRVPMQLAMLAGMSVNQIASELGVAAEEVVRRLREGLQLLEQQLRPKNFDDLGTQQSQFVEFEPSPESIDPSPELAHAFLGVVTDGSLHQEISAAAAEDPDLTL